MPHTSENKMITLAARDAELGDDAATRWDDRDEALGLVVGELEGVGAGDVEHGTGRIPHGVNSPKRGDVPYTLSGELGRPDA